MTGGEQGYDDARRFERAVEHGLLNVVAVDTDDFSVATRAESGMERRRRGGPDLCDYP